MTGGCDPVTRTEVGFVLPHLHVSGYEETSLLCSQKKKDFLKNPFIRFIFVLPSTSLTDRARSVRRFKVYEVEYRCYRDTPSRIVEVKGLLL